MTYATRADIETLYGPDELRLVLNLMRDAELSGDEIARVDAALSETSSQIESYLSVRYTLPLATVPQVLRSFAVDMTIYRLALRNGRPRDELRKRYDDAIAFLKSVAKGDANLPGVSTGTGTGAGGVAAAGSSGDVRFTGRGRTFDRDSEVMS